MFSRDPTTVPIRPDGRSVVLDATGGAAVLALQNAACRIAAGRQGEADRVLEWAEDRGQHPATPCDASPPVSPVLPHAWCDVEAPRPRNRKPRAWGFFRCATPLRRKIAAASPTPISPSETHVPFVAATPFTKLGSATAHGRDANDGGVVKQSPIERPELRAPPPLPMSPPPLPCKKAPAPRPPPLPAASRRPPSFSSAAATRGPEECTGGAGLGDTTEHGSSQRTLKEPATNPVRLCL